MMTAERISARDLQELLSSRQPVTVVDIRSPADREWSIPGSLPFDAYEAAKSGSLGPLANFNFPPGPRSPSVGWAQPPRKQRTC